MPGGLGERQCAAVRVPNGELDHPVFHHSHLRPVPDDPSRPATSGSPEDRGHATLDSSPIAGRAQYDNRTRTGRRASHAALDAHLAGRDDAAPRNRPERPSHPRHEPRTGVQRIPGQLRPTLPPYPPSARLLLSCPLPSEAGPENVGLGWRSAQRSVASIPISAAPDSAWALREMPRSSILASRRARRTSCGPSRGAPRAAHAGAGGTSPPHARGGRYHYRPA